MMTYANFFILVKNLRKVNFNFVDVMFSPTLTRFLFLTISKINIKLSNDIKFMEKTNETKTF